MYQVTTFKGGGGQTGLPEVRYTELTGENLSVFVSVCGVCDRVTRVRVYDSKLTVADSGLHKSHHWCADHEPTAGI